uniref:Uncharacterized protein n=1 Tax=Tetranychus urticae TaxID=32264 RepID=T1KK87_TETUR
MDLLIVSLAISVYICLVIGISIISYHYGRLKDHTASKLIHKLPGFKEPLLTTDYEKGEAESQDTDEAMEKSQAETEPLNTGSSRRHKRSIKRTTGRYKNYNIGETSSKRTSKESVVNPSHTSEAGEPGK